jgi:threonine dehydratase
VITVSEDAIVDAMALVWQRFRLLIEPSSATVIAAISASPEDFSGQRVGVIISGGNVDIENLPFKP